MSDEDKRAEDWFDSEAEFTAALEAAEENAKAAFDVNLVDNLTSKAQVYGMRTFLSESQYEHLKRIAGI